MLKQKLKKRLDWLNNQKNEILASVNNNGPLDEKDIILFGKKLEDLNSKITELVLVKNS